MVIWVVGILWSTIIGWVAVRNTGMAIIHRRTRSCVTVVPVPAPHPAIGFSIGHYKSGIGTFGIIGRADTVIILSIPIVYKFPYIPSHIIKPKSIGSV
jgi:hypothetical protein